MNNRLFWATGLLALSACSTEPVEPDLLDLKNRIEETSSELQAPLSAAIRREDEQRLIQSANNFDIWLLNPECHEILNGNVDVELASCEIDRLARTDEPVFIGPATGADRQLAVLQTYLISIHGLSTAQSEADIKENLNTALGILNEVGTAAEARGILSFVKSREAGRERRDAIIDAGVRAYRYQKLRSVVTSASGDVEILTREIQLQLIAAGIVPDYLSNVENLRSAETNALLSSEGGNSIAHLENIRALQSQRNDFINYYKGTVLFDLSQIANNHNALAATLRSPGSPEDYVEYLKSLKTLADTLER